MVAGARTVPSLFEGKDIPRLVDVKSAGFHHHAGVCRGPTGLVAHAVRPYTLQKIDPPIARHVLAEF